VLFLYLHRHHHKTGTGSIRQDDIWNIGALAWRKLLVTSRAYGRYPLLEQMEYGHNLENIYSRKSSTVSKFVHCRLCRFILFEPPTSIPCLYNTASLAEWVCWKQKCVTRSVCGGESFLIDNWATFPRFWIRSRVTTSSTSPSYKKLTTPASQVQSITSFTFLLLAVN